MKNLEIPNLREEPLEFKGRIVSVTRNHEGGINIDLKDENNKLNDYMGVELSSGQLKEFGLTFEKLVNHLNISAIVQYNREGDLIGFKQLLH
ncbi:MAG: hypothetical protein PHF35_00260 [Candidatus Moranbacteria bacterium]|nr:hypothetical protein [Candidatus Moranbacteria bacterium]